MTTDLIIEEKLLDVMKTEAKQKGLDPDLVRKEDIHVISEASKIQMKYGDVELTFPGPSQNTFDMWFKQNGPQIANTLLTLAGVAVGGLIAIAAVQVLKK